MKERLQAQLEIGFVFPNMAQISQALCLTSCIKRGFGGCTWDGLDCLDRYGETYQSQAEKIIQEASSGEGHTE